MPEFHRVTDNFHVSPQIDNIDLEEAAKEGFQVVISNRPDGEMFGQASMANVKAMSVELGMAFGAVPIAGPPSEDDVKDMSDLLDEAKGKKVLAYCRTGTRSTILWALAQAKDGVMDVDKIISLAAEAGYDISNLKGRMEGYKAL